MVNAMTYRIPMIFVFIRLHRVIMFKDSLIDVVIQIETNLILVDTASSGGQLFAHMWLNAHVRLDVGVNASKNLSSTWVCPSVHTTIYHM